MLSIFLRAHPVFVYKVGEWTPNLGLLMTSPGLVTFMGGSETVYHYTSNLAGKTLTLVTVPEPPFVIMATEDYNPQDLTDEDVEGRYNIINCLEMRQ